MTRRPVLAVVGRRAELSIEELIRRYDAGGGRLAKTSDEGLAVPPALHTVVLNCMDSPEPFAHQ